MMYTYDSPQGRANVAGIESKLAELDPICREFGIRAGYTFSPRVDLWPRRRVWRRAEIDRCMDLTMVIGVIGVQDVLDRGFYPELLWTLSASGSLRPGTDPDLHILSRLVFDHLPFSQLAGALANGLERGLGMLNSMTENDIRSQGEKCARPGTT